MELPQRQRESVNNNNKDFILKAKHHTNNKKDLNTLAQSTKSNYCLVFCKLLEAGDKKKHCVFCKES